jgi:hypothetical protein
VYQDEEHEVADDVVGEAGVNHLGIDRLLPSRLHALLVRPPKIFSRVRRVRRVRRVGRVSRVSRVDRLRVNRLTRVSWGSRIQYRVSIGLEGLVGGRRVSRVSGVRVSRVSRVSRVTRVRRDSRVSRVRRLSRIIYSKAPRASSPG